MSGAARRSPSALALAAALLGGCGFTPLYADAGRRRRAVAASRSTCRTAASAICCGEDLDDALARDQGERAAYRLEMVLDQSLRPRPDRRTTPPSATRPDLTVNLQLIDIASGKVATTGAVTSESPTPPPASPTPASPPGRTPRTAPPNDAAQQIQLRIAACDGAAARPAERR